MRLSITACCSRCSIAGASAADAAAPDPEAIEQSRRELDANPRDDGLRSRYGDLLFQSGDALGSLLVLNPGRKPNPKWADELRQAAGVYLDLAQHDAARRALRAGDPGDRHRRCHRHAFVR